MFTMSFYQNPDDMPYASQLDCQVKSQEFPYKGHSDYGFDKIEDKIEAVERENNRGGASRGKRGKE
jgi:hypothetical protein